MDEKFTPGPWEAINGTVNAENGSVFCVADCYTPSIGPNWSGTDYTGKDYQMANARLISAAPKLLGVMDHAIQWMQGDKWRFDADESKRDAWETMMRAMKDAVAQARGES